MSSNVTNLYNWDGLGDLIHRVLTEALVSGLPRYQRGLLLEVAAALEGALIRDKMREDGEHALIGEVEARDARIAKLEEELHYAREFMREEAQRAHSQAQLAALEGYEAGRLDGC